MRDPAISLKELIKEKEFLIGIDSDGCAFDAMEIKHKECFIPNIINVWDLQPISKYARETAEFVNLYSRWRGVNRFPALVLVMDMLSERQEVLARGFKVPDITALREWIESETRLGNPALEEAVNKTGNTVLAKALAWSNAVNESVRKIVRGVPPFPYVRESLELIQEQCDAIVVSATPHEALAREWAEHGLSQYVKVIAGQEMGTKQECLKAAKTGRYADDHVLMIGDALGDMKAARANNVLFYPINPGKEDESWKRFHDEAYGKFITGKYAGKYEEELMAEFETYLPAQPSWK